MLTWPYSFCSHLHSPIAKRCSSKSTKFYSKSGQSHRNMYSVSWVWSICAGKPPLEPHWFHSFSNKPQMLDLSNAFSHTNERSASIFLVCQKCRTTAIAEHFRKLIKLIECHKVWWMKSHSNSLFRSYLHWSIEKNDETKSIELMWRFAGDALSSKSMFVRMSKFVRPLQHTRPSSPTNTQKHYRITFCGHSIWQSSHEYNLLCPWCDAITRSMWFIVCEASHTSRTTIVWRTSVKLMHT